MGKANPTGLGVLGVIDLTDSIMEAERVIVVLWTDDEQYSNTHTARTGLGGKVDIYRTTKPVENYQRGKPSSTPRH